MLVEQELDLFFRSAGERGRRSRHSLQNRSALFSLLNNLHNYGIIIDMYKVEISPKTIIFTVAFLLGLYFLWSLKDLIFSIFIAFILMSALRPLVDWFEKKRVPHTLSVIIVYLSFILVFAFLFSLIIPPIVIETQNFIQNFPIILNNLNANFSWINADAFIQYIPNVTSRFFDIVSGVFSNTVLVISTLFFGFYLLVQEKMLKTLFSRFLNAKQVEVFNVTLDRLQKQMSAWFWGELTLMTVVGLLTFIGLNLIGMKYALALAVLAGLLEVIPNLGPILSAIPAILIGLAISPLAAGSVLAVYIIVQQLENNVIVPIIMRNAVGLNPIITLIALVIGGRIGGVLGVLLAIPAYLFIEVIVSEYYLKKNKSGEYSVNLREKHETTQSTQDAKNHKSK
jgi:predicted PurR-regulated permease PerM